METTFLTVLCLLAAFIMAKFVIAVILDRDNDTAC